MLPEDRERKYWIRMDDKLLNALQVRFVKLRFTVDLLEDSVLPKDKVSAIRGGMGEMLLRMNCVRDRQCDTCDFETECIVQKVMYSKFVRKPVFVTTGESIGYVLECEDYQEDFCAHDKLKFYLILFGKTIVYLNQLYQALALLGDEGLGKYHARFQIIDIRNMEGMPLLEGKKINMSRYVVHMLYDYPMFRTMQIRDRPVQADIMMIFDTPLTLKYRAEFIQEFQIEAILSAVRRRIFMLDCFEGIESDMLGQTEDEGMLRIRSQEHYWVSVSRYSNRKNEKMVFRGLKGYALLEGLTEELLTLLLVGELIHIGKNTSFGFGRYHLRFIDDH